MFCRLSALVTWNNCIPDPNLVSSNDIVTRLEMMVILWQLALTKVAFWWNATCNLPPINPLWHLWTVCAGIVIVMIPWDVSDMLFETPASCITCYLQFQLDNCWPGLQPSREREEDPRLGDVLILFVSISSSPFLMTFRDCPCHQELGCDSSMFYSLL